MDLGLVLIPLLGGFIGWVTNVAAVRLLFWPVRPIRLPGLPWPLQGVVPRRQPEIAQSVAEAVERLLVRPEDLVASLNGPAYEEEAAVALSRYVEDRIEHGVGRYLPGGLRAAVTSYARETARREAGEVVRAVLERVKGRLEREFSLAPTIAHRVARMDPAEFEAMLLRVIGRELRWLEVLGGVMGFLIGLLQLAVVGWAG